MIELKHCLKSNAESEIERKNKRTIFYTSKYDQWIKRNRNTRFFFLDGITRFPERKRRKKDSKRDNCELVKKKCERMSERMCACVRTASRLIRFVWNYKCQYVLFREWNSMLNMPFGRCNNHGNTSHRHTKSLTHSHFVFLFLSCKDFDKFSCGRSLQNSAFSRHEAELFGEPNHTCSIHSCIQLNIILYHHRKQNICSNGVCVCVRDGVRVGCMER